MSTINISNPTGRKTEARVVEVGHFITLYFSYSTLIGYEVGAERWRIDNHWGPTTGRHFRELGIAEWESTNSSPEDFATTAYRRIAAVFQPS